MALLLERNRGKVGWISESKQPDQAPHPNPFNGPGAIVRSVAPSAPHGGRFRRASGIKGDSLQPGEAIGNAAAQSCIFLIDYRHSNMMHSVTSVSLCLSLSCACWGLLFHHTMPPKEALQPPAPLSSFRAKLKKKN